MEAFFFCLLVVPVGILAGFVVHWQTIRGFRDPEDRLPYCRGAYLAFSIQFLVFAWAAFFLLTRKHPGAVLLPLGMTFSSLGDYFNLQFPVIRKRFQEPVFLGIISFSAAQVFYIAGFLSFSSFRQLSEEGFLIPLLVFFLAVPAVIFRLRIFRKDRPRTLMRGGFLYGFILGAMVAVAVSSAIALGGYWYLPAAGSLFFLLSDAVMGSTTLSGFHPAFEYQIPWGTYLAAQGLILLGTTAAGISG